MQGAFFLGKESIAMRELALPPLSPGDIRIRNRACGVCGTDVHIYHGEPGSADVTPPIVLGHEYSGEVVETGSGVTAFNPGDRVTVDPNIYCGVCHHCRNGKKQLCESMEAIGVTRNGGFAQYSVVPASQAFLLDPRLDWEAGAMAEPLACCIHGIDLAEIRAGQTVLVIGGGAIGLLMVQLARLSGAGRVLLSEPVELRRRVALSLGVDGAFDPKDSDPVEQVKLLSGQEGADVVIECVGKMAATTQAFDCAAKGATILLFSVPSVDASFDLPLFDVFKKELTIKGSFVNPDTHARAVELLNTGKISVAPLISHRYSVDQLEQAILAQMSTESIKVMVMPT